MLQRPRPLPHLESDHSPWDLEPVLGALCGKGTHCSEASGANLGERMRGSSGMFSWVGPIPAGANVGEKKAG